MQRMNFWVQIEEESTGPFTEHQLRAMLEKGALSPRDLAAPEGSADWRPLSLLFPSPDSEQESAQPSFRALRKPIIRLSFLLVILGVAVVLGLGGLFLALKFNQGAAAAAQVSATEATLHQTMTQIMSYRVWAGSYPSGEQGLSALVDRPTTEPLPRRWERLRPDLPVDAWGNALVYRPVPGQNDRAPEVISLGPDELLGTEDDISSKSLRR